MGYILGIPTRGRTNILYSTLEAIKRQTLLPNRIILIDNNDSPEFLDKKQLVDAEVVWNDSDNKSASAGHQKVLDIALLDKDNDVVIRWDDDLIPDIKCFKYLYNAVALQDPVACGGTYPRLGENRRITSRYTVPDGCLTHLQFFNWTENRIIKTYHLYSSFAYDKHAADAVGGFCLDYKSYREETDFTLRLSNMFGPLWIDTRAKAVHHVSSGGTRERSQKEQTEMAMKDFQLFRDRMIERKISPEY